MKRFAVDAVIQRQPSGYYDEHGRWKDRPIESLTIKALVQPASPDDMSSLPENRRSRATISVWTSESLQVLDVSKKNQPDKIEYQDNVYEAFSQTDWSRFGFFVTLATRIEP